MDKGGRARKKETKADGARPANPVREDAADEPHIEALDTDALGAVDGLLRGRRTVHEFRPEPPPRALVDEALELSRWAPNHRHTTPWRWYRPGRRTIEKICGLNARTVRQTKGEEAARKKLERWLKLPGWLVLTAPVNEDDPLRHQEDYAACCCAAQNFMLALWARGIGAKWSTGPVSRHPELYQLLGIDPMAEHVVGIFWYGFPAQLMDGRREPIEASVIDRP